MAEFLRYTQITVTTHYEHRWVRRDDPNSGLYCPCDAAGEIDWDALHEIGRKNIQDAFAGEGDVYYIYQGIKSYQHRQVIPAAIRCVCGAEVELYDPFLSTCDKCGRDYNGGGQLLAPRSQWGEETGESLADIFNGRWED